MISSNNLNLKDWQSYYLKLDPSYGNLIASILQSIFKNTYSTVNSLINTIKKKQSKIVTEEGTIDLMLKFDEVIKLTPKFQIVNTVNEENKNNALSITCDFVITLNFDNIIGFDSKYVDGVNELLSKVNANNKKILIKYLIKQLSLGNYFISMDFLEKEIFDAKVLYTDYTISNIFQKFKITRFNTIYSLLNSNNYDDDNNMTTNIKVLSVPFTPFHMDTYLSRELQHIYRIKYNIGKGELNTKLIYLNAEYQIDEKKRIYDLLVFDVYSNYLPSKTDRNCENDYKLVFDDNLPESSDKKNNLDIEEFTDKFERKRTILKILKTDKIPKHEIDFLDSLDYDKLHIKNTFVAILNHLSNPFLSKIINTAQIRFLKQYIVTNYGTNIKESISEESRDLIEKKFADFIQSKDCFFIEFYNTIIQNICNSTGEKRFLVDTIIRTSGIFKNFCFVKYLAKPKKTVSTNFQVFLKSVGSDFFGFFNDGAEDDMVIIPYIKIKEFLIYLTTNEINSNWQKLKEVFDEILKSVNSLVFSASKSGAEVKMVILDSVNFNISVKDKNNLKNFQIKSFDDIEFIFQEKEQEKFKSIIKMLYNLHQKNGFGFDNKKDFNKYMALYNSRCDEYNVNKMKLDQYEESTSNTKGIIAFLKKLLFWIPMAITNHNLFKIMKKNDEIVKKVKYYYNEPQECQPPKVISLGGNSDLNQIKGKIIEFIGNEEKKSSPADKIENNKSLNLNKKKENKEEKPSLPELDNEEEKLFEFINKHLKSDKDIMFTRSSDMDEEIIVIYVKDNKSPTLFSGNTKDLNTIDEYSTRYFNIKKLINKRYLSQKELIRTTEDNKKICYLTYARQYYQLMNKYRS